jgi:uracil-DNA glycosylase family 4
VALGAAARRPGRGGGVLLVVRAVARRFPTVGVRAGTNAHRTLCPVAHHGPPAGALRRLSCEIEACEQCPRLVSWRRQVAAHPRAAFAGQTYWGRPVAGFGDPGARLLVVGLAPAAHGGNRTGRVFTGDRSGDWLFAALWRAGYANQPLSVERDDGLELRGAWVSAVVRCAPPDNKPTREERDSCLPFFGRERSLLESVRVIVALGQFALAGVGALLGLRPLPRFSHLGEHRLADGRVLLSSYHPSQQNTFTGRLTEEMFDAVFARARALGA